MERDVVTLREVARAAGVHPGTASRALNDATRSLVRPATVDRVIAAAQALGYRPNYLARSFKTRKTHSVGVVIPDITNPLFPPIFRGVEDRLTRDGYVTLLANTGSDEAHEERIFSGMLERRVDGLILATARREDSRVAELAQEGVPIVLINRIVKDHSFPSVSVDDAAGIRMVVDHLCELGHERIAHVAGPQNSSTGSLRRGGFVSSMSAHGLEVGPQSVAYADRFAIAEGQRCAGDLLSAPNPPTAIVAANDMLALGCYTAAEALGLRCPEDVSVVGFNDMPFTDRMSPPLTTVRFPHYEVGAQAADLLLGRIHDPELAVKVMLMVPTLVVRGSTARAPVGAGVG